MVKRYTSNIKSKTERVGETGKHEATLHRHSQWTLSVPKWKLTPKAKERKKMLFAQIAKSLGVFDTLGEQQNNQVERE